MQEDKKVCIKCNEEQILSNFYFYNKEKGIYQNRCKDCHKNKNKVKEIAVIKIPEKIECNFCKEIKDIKEFVKSKYCKYGIKKYCKKCHCEKQKKRRLENIETHIAKGKISNKKYYEKNKEKIIKRTANNAINRLKNDKEYRKITYLRSANRSNLKRAIKYYLEGKTDKLPSKSPSKMLLKLYEIQNHICPYCNNDMTDNIHIDHIIPLSKNGSNEVENLILCCSNCNLSKYDKNLNLWLEECNIDYNNFVLDIEERNKLHFS